MSQPKHYHLQGRILATFAVMALVLLALGGLNLISAQRIERDARNFTERVIPKLILTDQFTGKLGLVEGEVFHHIVATRPEHMREVETRLAELYDENTVVFEKMGALMEHGTERQLYDQVRTLRQENKVIRDRLLALSRTSKSDARLSATLHQHLNAYERYQEEVLDLAHQIEVGASGRWAAGVGTIDRFRTASHLLLGLGLAVGLAMTVIIARVARMLAESNRLFEAEIAERRRAEAAVVGAIEGEQRRIAHDLHDGLVQHLAGVFFLSETLGSTLRQAAPGEAALAARITELLGQAVTQARGLARGLNPVELEARGLAAALEDLAASLEQTWKVPCLVEWDGFADDGDEPPATGLGTEVETHLYRIAQEAMNNAIRHGAPGGIRVLLAREADGLLLSVEDDGTGLSQRPEAGSGMGLRSMQYRAGMIGARLEIAAVAGGGTRVLCKIPDHE